MSAQPPPPETFSLAGKNAIVTGAGRDPSIGAAIATALARNGANVVLNFLTDGTASSAQACAERLRAEYGVKAITVQQDITSEEGCQKVVEKAIEGFGEKKIDILVNNAGWGTVEGTVGIPAETIEKHFAINVYAPTYLVRATIPYMPSGSRIINVSSIASKWGNPATPFYCAAKAAQDSLTHTWAFEFGRSHGITVNTVAPGPVKTHMLDYYEDGNPDGFGSITSMRKTTRAADRLGEVADIADAVLLLVQEKSRWITGQFISVSGGLTGPYF